VIENLDYWKLYLQQKLNNANQYDVFKIEDPTLVFKVFIYSPRKNISGSNYIWFLERAAVSGWQPFNPFYHPYFVDQPWISTVHCSIMDKEIMDVSEEELHVILDTCTRISKLALFI